MIEWDNSWYDAWNILLNRLSLEEIKIVAKCFDITTLDTHHIGDEDIQKREWISLIGNMLRDYRNSQEKWGKANRTFRQFKELMGIWND